MPGRADLRSRPPAQPCLQTGPNRVEQRRTGQGQAPAEHHDRGVEQLDGGDRGLRFPGLISHVGKASSLYRVLADVYGTAPVNAEETIETAAASPREAELLSTDTGSPMLVLGRHSFDARGEPIEWVHSWYRGDRYVFVAKLSAGH